MKISCCCTLFIILFFAVTGTKAQQATSPLLNNLKKNVAMGGYGDIEFIQPINIDTRNLGKLDIHRFVLMLGYQFNKRLKLVSEIEFEHVKEVYIEQAFLDYKINKWVNWRSGLILIPMGIINERHESNTFNGVLRPSVDKYIVPTTWREIGTGFHGNLIDASIRYQAYLVNGFNGYDGNAKFNGENGLRGGRQKGAKSYLSTPNLSAKIEHYGFTNLKLSVSAYLGKSQSQLYNSLDKNDGAAVAQADSSVVNIQMLGFDASYRKAGFELKGQFIFTHLGNTAAYNTFANSNIGSNLMGYYAEAGYNVFAKNEEVNDALVVFARYEKYNTHQSKSPVIELVPAYNRNLITTGLTWKPSPQVAYKADIQMLTNASTNKFSNTLNFGIGFAF